MATRLPASETPAATMLVRRIAVRDPRGSTIRTAAAIRGAKTTMERIGMGQALPHTPHAASTTKAANSANT